MSAPTNVRVEATSQGTTAVRWSYSGAAQIAVYRSTDGAIYAEATAAGSRVAAGTLLYEDTGLLEGTKYWYKLSDDLGATYSSVVTVWTHGCPAPSPTGSGVSLPRLETGGADPAEQFNELAQKVEDVLGERLLTPEECAACPDDGALRIDCASGCVGFEVVVDQDINSISLLNCDDAAVDINFIIPPNVTRRIGGWPKGIGFTGDEGNQAPVSGGSSGRSINEFVNRALNTNSKSGKSKPGTSTKGTASGGLSRRTGNCTCVPGTNGELTIRACNADGTPNSNNSLSCASAKSLTLMVCGGRGPYTWSRTGSVGLKGKSGTTPGATAEGTSITVTPPTNSGSAVAGTAYFKQALSCRACAGSSCTSFGPPITSIHSCDDVSVNCVSTTGACGSNAGKVNGDFTCCPNSCGNDTADCPNFVGGNAYFVAICDQRSAPMISAGCNPCGVQAGATVTVTDAAGVSTTVVLTA